MAPDEQKILTQATQLRGVKRRLLTKTISKLDVILQLPSAQMDWTELKANSRLAKSYVTELAVLDAKVIEAMLNLTMSDDDLQRDIETSKEYELKVDLRTCQIDNLSTKVQPTVVGHKPVKLPQLKLPTFDGDILEYDPFMDQFIAAIGSEQSLSGVQKLAYLKGCLSGDAYKLVENTPNVDSSYSLALDILKKAFANKVVTSLTCVDRLLNMELESENCESILKFRSTYESIIGRLDQLGYGIDGSASAQVLIVGALMSKIPDTLRVSIQRTAGNRILELDGFREAMQCELDLLASSTAARIQNSTTIPAKGQPVGTAMSLNVNAVSRRQEKPKQCHFCSKTDHTSRYCTKYGDLDSRYKRLRSIGGRCDTCWLKSHKGKNCMKMTCQNCKENHWVALCKSDQKASGSTITKTQVATMTCGSSQPVHPASGGSLAVAIPTLDLPVQHGNSNVYSPVRALIDQGSQRTLVLSRLVKNLKLPKVGSERLDISGLAGGLGIRDFDIVEVVLRQGERNRKRKRLKAVVVDDLPTPCIPEVQVVMDNIETKGFRLAIDSRDNPIQLLVGSDFYFEVINPKRMAQKVSGVWLLQSYYGFIMSGSLQVKSDSEVTSVSVLEISIERPQSVWHDSCLPNSDPDLNKLWELENIGISHEIYNTEEDMILKKFNESITFTGDRYKVKLPWKSEDRSLPSNFGLAKGRLNSLLVQGKKKNFIHTYQQVLDDQLSRGFIEYVPVEEIGREHVHYLPHHGVQRDHPTTPLRVVFDCSAKASKLDCSLNDLLYSGPSLVPELTQIILRFRCCKYVCASDISKAFLQVELHEDDREFTRFLWVRDPDRGVYDRDNLIFLRFRVVLFGACSSPFLLQATIQHHLSRYDGDMSNLHRNLYVDNLHGSTDTQEELVDFYRQARKCYGAAGFELREWVTNSPALEELIETDSLGPKENSNMVKILGITWNISEDTLSIPMIKYKELTLLTKRIVVSETARLFDPVGFLTPMTVKAKVLIQAIWRLKYGWDESLPDELVESWQEYVRVMTSVPDVAVPRLIFHSRCVSLHMFSDASELAFGCCAYIVGASNSRLVMSKGRVAPLKEMTVPKLELTAALLSVRMARYILTSYKYEVVIDSVTFWIDSSCALQWIVSVEAHKNIFVRNRVREIQSICKGLPKPSFYHVPTQENPADLVTRIRILSMEHFLKETMWWNGPSWLIDKKAWPQSSFGDCVHVADPVEASEDASIFSEGAVSQGNIVVNNIMVSKEIKYSDSLPHIENFSKYMRLIRATVYVQKFIFKLKKIDTDNQVSVGEINTAENKWIIEVQKQHFSQILEALDGKEVKLPSVIKQLNIKLMDGLLKVQTRLENSSLDVDTKYPILLPGCSRFTELLILHQHSVAHHSSTTSMMVVLRERFWITKARQTVKRSLKGCMVCRRYNANLYKIPISPPLPEYRVVKGRAFQFVGVDFTGALYIKIGNGVEKAYIALFTCCTTRAVHLDLARDMSSDEFALIFRRFISRRGVPQIMFSDNGSNFKGHCSLLDDLYSGDTVESLLQTHRVEWRFITPRAQWFGALWERLIGVTKRVLRRSLGKSMLTYCEMYTVLTEVESRINDRPLTYVAEDQTSYLTPSQLMTGYKLNSLPVPVEESEFVNQSSEAVLNKRLKKVLLNIDNSWNLWHSQYLLLLRDQEKKLFPERGSNIVPSAGDVVLLADDKHKAFWSLGLVLDVKHGTDGKSRVAKLRTKGGILYRPIARLYYLESTPICTADGQDKTTETEPVLQLSVPRDRRAASTKMLTKLSDWIGRDAI